jgi:hypothetical protein
MRPRSAARRRAHQEANAALLRLPLSDYLGLVEPEMKPKPYVVINGRTFCATCRQRAQPDGICRRATCTAGGAR